MVGPAASVRGAVYLSGIDSGVVMDIGGTSTDVAFIVNGFPRESSITVTMPDLILILDSETGEPIRTDIVKYGYRGTIVVVPADEKMRTEMGIKTFGPKYFGYDEDYVPVEELVNL
ncbi:hypothetical protein AN618_10410 [Fervidicola ferrireducens]|uniref:S-Me-THD-like C-terminal domain-containing protein n=1 Tax=Fervidicola ferrireducens TaxID=520764 RepID=A0A140LAB4_9FIRM|nr:hydantoinase/oxoprolinase family protein [Fervidicola ferrireducens]KXG77489.1 hypothetical protein AN618_10410 [Fervidicola ferrireducens]